MDRRRAILLLAVAFVATACRGPRSTGIEGTLSFRFTAGMLTNPLPTPTPTAGVVEVSRGSAPPFKSIRVSSTGRFVIQLPPGRYRVSAYIPNIREVPGESVIRDAKWVTVHDRDIATVDLLIWLELP